MWQIYVLQCCDDSFYTGITDDLKGRILRHNAGRGAVYTKRRLPVKLIYVEAVESKTQALMREKEVKDFSRKNKLRLIKFGIGRRFAY